MRFVNERLKDNNLILNTFMNNENILPLSIKLYLLFLAVALIFVVNGIFFGEDYISERFHDTNKETFFSFVPRSIERFLYTNIVSDVISSIAGLFFLEEKKVKGLLLREQNNENRLKLEISLLVRQIQKRFIYFIILCFVIELFSLYYVSCFNSV